MATVALPLEPSIPNYRVGTTLDGVVYLLDVRWNSRDEAWFLDLLAEDETPIVRGIRVVLGALLGSRSADPAFPPGVLIASDLAGTGTDPGFDDLGQRVKVYYIPDADG